MMTVEGMMTARVITTIDGCISLRSRSIVVMTLAVIMLIDYQVGLDLDELRLRCRKSVDGFHALLEFHKLVIHEPTFRRRVDGKKDFQ